MYRVYLHRKESNGELFYVGITSNKRRPNRVDNRNPIWTNIYSKHGRTVEIIAEGVSKEDACELEEFIVRLCGRRDIGTGNLANCSGGGEINKGMIPPNKIKEPKAICKACGKTFVILRSKRGKLQTRKTCSQKCMSKIYEGKGYKKGTIPWNKGIKSNKPSHNSRQVLDTVTNKVYKSISEVSREFNISSGRLSKKLRGLDKNNTNFKFI